jgi:hypothetical protein
MLILLLEFVDTAFDDVALPVAVGVEGRWSAAGPAASTPVDGLVFAFGG